MIVLFGVIAVIYSPLTHLARIPSAVVNASVTAVSQELDENDKEIPDPNKLSVNDRQRLL